jgi:serine/threonine protein kinase/Flp pilus assembly protein TadD
MSKTEEGNDKGPDKEESIPTASMGGSAVGPGGQIGPYKLLSILGEGGFGVVYLAERQRPVKRRVALKVIKPGMDTKQVIARFEAERQALALLEHPNIAHVFNAGTTDAGRPYFVMEYVKGVPITEHCDRHKLTIEERLKLFLQVCEAVRHAHQKGIIHRDIKPSNIQVCVDGEKAVPKVIDFGVVKAISQPLTERTLVTEQGQFIGTPEYMSPEQAEMTGQDVDTRSDIYSLGVVLYELLTGVLPFEAKILREGGVEHIRQVIREEDPKTPSTRLSTLGGEESTMLAQRRRVDPGTLRRRLRGDLDWITLKAMEKDRTRRYQTAHALDEDIQRHLTHEPVLAGPPSRIYRLKKFLRKYRTQAIAAATAAVLLACIAVIFVMYVQAVNRGKEADSLKHRDILSKAMELRSSGQFQEALTKVQAIVDSEHVGPKAHLLRARLVLELQGPAAAVKELQKLLNERDEIACHAHFLLARIYLESDAGDPETAQEYQQKAKEHQQKGEGLFSESAEAYFNRSMMAGTVDKTLEWLNKAIDFEPGHYDSREARALAYYALRRYGEMEIDASVMIGNESNNSQGYALRAIARRQKAIRQSEKELLDEAIRDHDKAIKLSPDEPELYNQRRRTYMQMGNYEQALLDARKCVELEPEESIYRFHSFCALVASGYYDEAKVKYEAIIESGLMSKWNFEQSAAKYVSDTLDAGLSWHRPERRPEGAAFFEMHESAETYKQLAKKARRVVAEGFHANWSPDGSQLVYSSGIHGFTGIEIINLENGKTRLLTVPGFDPAWSPDGQYIAYVRSRQSLLLADVTTEYGAEIAPQAQREVWIIKADGTGEPRFLARGSFPCWSRDSKRVFYHSQKDMILYSVSIEDGAKPTPIVRCPSNYPVVSTDEKYVAYIRSGELRILELVSKSVVANWWVPPLSTGLILNWSPNGRELSISGRGLWIYNLGTKTASKVLSGRIGWSSWSRPDMSRFAFQRTYGKLHRGIWVADLDPNVSTTETLGPGRTVEQHYQEMISLYTRRIETDPEDQGNYLSLTELMENLALLGAGQYRAGAYEEALATLSHVDKLPRTTLNIQSHPRDAASIAMSLHQLGRDREAEAALDRLRILYEDGKGAHEGKYLYEAEQLFVSQNSKVHLAWESIEAGKLKEAWQLAEELRSLPRQEYTEIASSIESAIKSLTRAYHNRGKGVGHRGGGYGEAISDYEAAVRIDPNYALGFADLAWLRAACPAAEFRDGAKAIENATKACELTDWKDHNYVATLAAVYAEVGDFVAAVKWQKEAIDLSGEDKSDKWQPGYELRLKLFQSGKPYHGGNLWSFSTGGIVAWWKFDGTGSRTAVDSSGSGLDGKLSGDAQIISHPERGSVLSLDGEGDYVDCGKDSAFDITNSITITAWVNITTVPTNWMGIVTKSNTAWRLSTAYDQRRFHFAISPGAAGHYINGNIEVAAGQWHHVCGTYDGTNIRLYVDGVEDPKSPMAYSGSITTNGEPVYIGGNMEGPERYWNGLIDDVRIYSYGLSEAEIKAVYAGKESGPTSN